MKNRTTIVVVIVSLLLMLLVFTLVFFGKNYVPKDAYIEETNAEGEVINYILTPKYNVLLPADKTLFKAPYCEKLAESRANVTSENEDLTKNKNSLFEAVSIAKSTGDERASEILATAYAMLTEKRETLTEEEKLVAHEKYLQLVGLAKEKCGFEYQPQPNPDYIEKLNKRLNEKQPESVAEQLSEEEQLVYKDLQEKMVAPLQISYTPPNLGINTELYNQPYCEIFTTMNSAMSAGGTAATLDELLFSNLEQIVNQPESSGMTNEKKSIYNNYLAELKNIGGFYSYVAYLQMGYGKNPNQGKYLIALKTVSAVSTADCGVNLNEPFYVKP